MGIDSIKEIKAKDIFEKLGYELHINTNDQLMYIRKKEFEDLIYTGSTEDYEVIEFRFDDYEVLVYYCIASNVIPYEKRSDLTIWEYKAIAKQIEELNW